MSVAILLITHENIAESLLTTAQAIVNDTYENTASIEVPMDTPIEQIESETRNKLHELDTDDGLLLITDLIGSTPFNIATTIKEEQNNAMVVSGINLSMMIKLYNYRELQMAELAEKALIGGENGIDTHE